MHYVLTKRKASNVLVAVAVAAAVVTVVVAVVVSKIGSAIAGIALCSDL